MRTQTLRHISKKSVLSVIRSRSRTCWEVATLRQRCKREFSPRNGLKTPPVWPSCPLSVPLHFNKWPAGFVFPRSFQTCWRVLTIVTKKRPGRPGSEGQLKNMTRSWGSHVTTHLHPPLSGDHEALMSPHTSSVWPQHTHAGKNMEVLSRYFGFKYKLEMYLRFARAPLMTKLWAVLGLLEDNYCNRTL